MADFVCPRCHVTVITPGDEDPRCTACDYPGADARPESERHPLAAGDDRVLSGKAVASMVLGITSVTVPLAGLAAGITAVPLALKAHQDVARAAGLMSGRKHANAGLALGIVGIGIQAALFGGSIAAAWHRFRS